MFREIKVVKQIPGEPLRRWYSSNSMDLFVWISDSEQIVSFQLSYNKPYAEKALTWRVGQGFCHDDIDEGSRPGKHPASPILQANGEFKAKQVLAMFSKEAVNLDESLREFIETSINHHFIPEGN